MSKTICLFNHKSGVGKTTFAYNLAWSLAEKNQNVILLDCDPQCNLSGLVYGFSEESQEINYDLLNERALAIGNYKSIYEYLMPKLFPIAQTEFEPNKPIYRKSLKNIQLDVLRGDIRTSNFDFQLVDSIMRPDALASAHLPIAFDNAISEISQNYDFTILDLSPNLGVFNLFSVMISDYFLVPVMPGFFSLQAVDNLKSIFKEWDKKINIYRPDGYRPTGIKANPKFLGIVSQDFRKYDSEANDNKVVKTFTEWENRINLAALEFAHSLEGLSCNMTITKEEFANIFTDKQPYCIGRISDFNKLKGISEKFGLPVVALTKDYIDSYRLVELGINQQHYINQISECRETFSTICDGLLKLN